MNRSCALLTIGLLAGFVVTSALPAQTIAGSARSTHVIVVITDGLRWQELFGGADATLMGAAGKVADTAGLRRQFWRDTPVARRETLLPFLWTTIASQGQIFGDSTAGSKAVVTNGYKFSYPGYSEAFTGHADRRIDSNNYPPNPHQTVFEWLNRQPALQNRVAAFATWAAFRRIINTERSKVPVYDGWDNVIAPTGTPRAAALRDLASTHTRMWGDNAWDALTHWSALDYVDVRNPRVLFIGYGETDEWAHAGRYDMYLRSAHQVDAYLKQLWERAQANPETRGRTTLIVTTDHGRGNDGKWTDHGEDVIGAERWWAAVMGPDVPALGVRANTPSTQSQIAATIAAALGYDWPRAESRAAAPLPVFGAKP
jgi:hypothetical protein